MELLKHFGQITPFYIKNDLRRFEECLKRVDCPLLYRPEFCERCDGYYPLCHRVDMRPIHDVHIKINNLLADLPPEAKTK